ALVDPLQMAAIGGDGAHALVITFQGAGDGQLAAAAFAFGGLFRRRSLGRHQLAADLLAAAFLFFLILQAAAARLGRRFGGLGFEAAAGFLFGALLGQFIGGLARFLFRLALFGGGALGLQLFLFLGAAAGIFLGMAARFGIGDTRIGKGGGAARL